VGKKRCAREILHDYEGPSRDPALKPSVAEMVARKPKY
jgi:hypothetical protein